MVNTIKVKKRIQEKKKTIKTIAPKIPCSPRHLEERIENEKPINLQEMFALCEELDITSDSIEEFFLQK
ncbi:MAG: hypothetical protein HFJ52_01890 [Clostridia bacterium]|nr:hypothetical protein [Clostridia bacterium]